MTSNNQINALKIEYEGQSYTVDAAKIQGLDDEQIISLLSVGFPGMAGGKIERQQDGSLKIIKRVGTKGSNSLLELLKVCPEDSLPLKIENLNQQLIEELTIAQWEQIYEGWDLEAIAQILEQRESQIRSLIVRLYYCPTKIRPLI
ncbi:MAG: hypothetical protein HC930_04900 [Hydrococcus sp. SU_1_0]|nr:hypothetical protein [Hydrococcus sp. SU_1_0]NJO97718.1 hypothetical protein [Pleurocapsa sp. CRU_1_2]